MPVNTLPTVFLGLFDRSSDDGDDIERIASRLGASASAADVERRIDTLGRSMDRLVSAADLPESAGPSPDSDPVEKAESLRRAIETDRIRIEGSAPGRGNDGRSGHAGTGGRGSTGGRDRAAAEAETVRQAARSVSREVRPSASVSSRLLDQLSGSRRATEEQVEETLREALEHLDEHERAMDVVDRTDGVEDVAELAERRRDASRRNRRAESGRDRLQEAVTELLAAVDVDVDDDETLDRRVREATRTLREREPTPSRESAPSRREGPSEGDGRRDDRSRGGTASGSTDDSESVRTAVRRARESTTPRSREARTLFEALETGRVEPTTDALETAATRLDELATARSLLDSVDPGDVSTLAGTIDDRLADHEGPIVDRLADRVEELDSRIDRIDETNRVLLVAAHEELTFYDRQLLGALDATTGSGAGADAEAVRDRVASLRERRETIETEYVEERSDHNHSIPLYFLSIADTYLEEATERLNAGKPARADGICTVTEAVIDHIEGLYEQNQYSVMLRSLRG
ncbi:hypothetical protein [Halopenitus sp. POP-27]|uniref:hypothetical protein n=1 Tax=Halopenitus sp. POP-27 TaxID=2994425 RepID=UPI002469183A|nr:hypothetical protein [Halopenitus sp. POP-27]